MKLPFNISTIVLWRLAYAATLLACSPLAWSESKAAFSVATDDSLVSSQMQSSDASTAAVSDLPPSDSTPAMFPHFKNSRFWLSGQMNFVFETHPEFRAPYSGPHSLSPN